MVSAQNPHLGAPELPFDLQLVIEHLPIADLANHGRKLRLHKKQDITALANAIRTFGFLAPVIIDRDDKIVSGNGRIEAARQLGMTHVPCIRAVHLDAAKLKAFRIAENQLSQMAGWDTEALGLELKELSNLKLDFSLEVTGFSAAKIDSLILEGDRGGENADVSPDRPSSPVSRVGDLWLLGDHRLYCGDATDPASFDVLLQGEQVRTVFTDPPYNVAVDGHITGSGHHGEFVMASGEMTDAEFTDFSIKAMSRAAERLVEGWLLYWCMDWHHTASTLAAATATSMELVNLIVWDKTAGGMGSFYRSRHELIFLLRKPGALHLNRVELGKHGRNRANVWAYEGVNGFGAKKAKAREMHLTVTLTGSGGEGMVVKPRDFISRGGKGLIQPALKVRGREYLRIIYGPEYDAPDNLVRLRERGLGGKRNLALREFALGHEALKRFVAREPLRRVHECVFAVLALESEPIDPRL